MVLRFQSPLLLLAVVAVVVVVSSLVYSKINSAMVMDIVTLVKQEQRNNHQQEPQQPVKEPPCPVPGLETIKQYRQYLYNQEDLCHDMRQFGGHPPAPIDGKKFVCLDKRFGLTPGDCLVFSFGINNEWSFEDDMANFGCEVFAFDPTMGKEDHQHSAHVRFQAVGIANYRGTKIIGMGKNWAQRKVDRLENLVRDLGLVGRRIDYIKLDVELSEIDFLQDMLFNAPQLLDNITQIAMEVHDGYFKDDLSQTSRQQVFWPYFMLMRCRGFKLIQTRNAGAWREVVWARVPPHLVDSHSESPTP